MKRNRLALVAAGAAVGFLASLVILPGIVEAFTARGSAGGEVLALEGGRILTQTGDGVVTGTVLVRDGVIAEVGEVAIPEGARRIDVSGMVVTPGLIDVRSGLWLDEGSAREGSSDAGLDVLDGIDTFDEDWREVVRQGVTAVYVQPASTGTLGGRGAVLRVGPGRAAESLVIQASAGAQASLGIAGKSDTSRDRFAQYEQIKKALEAAKKYDEEWKKYEESTAAKPDSKKDDAGKTESKKSDGAKSESKKSDTEKSEQGGPAQKSDEKGPPGEGKAAQSKDAAKQSPPSGAATKPAASAPPKKPAQDPAKDFLRKVLHREVPLRIEAHREDDIANALKLGEEFGIRVVLEGLSDPKSSLDTVRSRRTPLVLGPVIETDLVPAYRRNRPDSWLKSLAADEVRWAIGTFDQQPRGSRLLRAHAAAAVAEGIAADRVLRAITRDAAAILGVDDRLGTIAKGKRADLAVFAGNPLDPSVPVRLVVSKGEIVYESSVKPLATEKPAPGGLSLPSSLPATYAIKTQRYLTDRGVFEPRTVVVKDGKVDAVESAIAVPSDVASFDVGSAVVTPGLIVAHSDLGLDKSIDETADADASYIRAVDVYDPTNSKVRELMREGFLACAYSPGSSNVAAGCVGVVRLGAAEPIRATYIAGKFVLTASSRNQERYPASLAGQAEFIERVLSSRTDGSNLFLPSKLQDELQAERKRHVAAMLSRDRVAMFEAGAEAEIDAALRLVSQFKLRAVLLGPRDIEPFLGEIKRLGVAIVARPIRASDYDRHVDALAAAAKAGVPVAFGSGSAVDLRMTAALLANAGMPRERALAGLASGAAELLGMPPGVGRIEPGQPADLVVWSGSPLDLGSRPLAVIVDGKLAATREPGKDGSRKGSTPIAMQKGESF